MQQQVANAAAAAPMGRPIPMVTKLAYRNLFHDRMSLVALIGYVLGIALSLVVIWASRGDPSLLIIMTPNLAMLLFVLTVGMCVFAAVCAIFKVIRIDPAVVFSR